jgi:hypothetical protein
MSDETPTREQVLREIDALDELIAQLPFTGLDQKLRMRDSIATLRSHVLAVALDEDESE